MTMGGKIKAFLVFTAMTAAALALLRVADGFSGGMLSKVGAR